MAEEINEFDPAKLRPDVITALKDCIARAKGVQMGETAEEGLAALAQARKQAIETVKQRDEVAICVSEHLNGYLIE